MCPAPSRLKAIMPAPEASVTKICIPAIMRFSAPFMALRPIVTCGCFPQQDVMLEEDRHLRDIDGQHRHTNSPSI